jgi:enterochelin esterase-like enzyme
VCEAEGYHEPAWASSRADVPAGSIVERDFDSTALGRHAAASMYLPAGFDADAAHRYPVVILHDGGDYFHYAGLATVLDQLIADGALPPVVVAGLHPVERLVEYADDARHHEFVTTELVEWLDTEFPLSGERYLAGASFGAVASLSAAVAAPQRFDGLLLQSGSFAGAGTGCWPRPEPLWQPVKRFVEGFLADPFPVAKRVAVTCGLFESLICENRGLVPTLSRTGMRVSFDEWLDGHNWASWRNSLGVALPRLMAG